MDCKLFKYFGNQRPKTVIETLGSGVKHAVLVHEPIGIAFGKVSDLDLHNAS